MERTIINRRSMTWKRAAIKPLRNKQVAFAIYTPGNTFPSVCEKSEIARLFRINEENRERERERGRIL